MRHVSSSRLLALLAEPGALEADAHVAGCARCQQRAATLRRHLETLQTEPPALAPQRSDALIRSAITAAASKEGEAPAWFRWTGLAAGGLVAAAAALLVLVLWKPGTETAPTGGVVVAEGTVGSTAQGQALPDGLEQTAQDAVHLTWADGTELWADPKTRFAVTEGGTRIQLAVGRVRLSVTKRAPGSRFVVATREAEVRVVGTRFTVARSDEARTQVDVEEGIVEVAPIAPGAPVGTTGTVVQRLTAGMSTAVGSPPATPSTTPSTTPSDTPTDAPTVAQPSEPTSPVKPPRDPQTRPPRSPQRHHVTAKDVRGALQRGSASDARSLLEQARSEAALDAELALAEAETLQAEGRPADALTAYLSVYERYGRGDAAEDALFAAAQLAILHGGKAHPPRPLFELYLKRYPGGRYRQEAESLLEALRPKP